MVHNLDGWCSRKMLKVNKSKSKVLLYEKNGHSQSNVSLNEEVLQVVMDFMCLGTNQYGWKRECIC